MKSRPTTPEKDIRPIQFDNFRLLGG